MTLDRVVVQTRMGLSLVRVRAVVGVVLVGSNVCV